MRIHEWLNSTGVVVAIIIGVSSGLTERVGILASNISGVNNVISGESFFLENETNEFIWFPKILLINTGDRPVTVRYAFVEFPIFGLGDCSQVAEAVYAFVDPSVLESGASQVVETGHISYSTPVDQAENTSEPIELCFSYSLVDHTGEQHDGHMTLLSSDKAPHPQEFIVSQGRCLTFPTEYCF